MRALPTALLCLLLSWCTVLPAAAADANPADTLRRFSSLEQKLASDPIGFAKYDAHTYEDYSPTGFAARIARSRHVLAALSRIDPNTLPHNEQITYGVIRWNAESVVDRAPYLWLQFPYTPYEFLFNGPNRVLINFTFHTDGDVDKYLHLAGQYGKAIASMVTFIDAQQKHGVYVQRDVAKSIRRQITGYATAPAASFAWPSDERLRSISPEARHRLRNALRIVIERHIDPALMRLANEFNKSYQAAAPVRYGLAQYPGGREYYKVLVKYNLTLPMNPEDIYRESLSALDSIHVDLKALRSEMGFFGSQRVFDRRLAKDPRYIAKTPADVEKTYLDYMSRIAVFLPKLFCRPAPYGYAVQQASPAAEAALTYGYSVTETVPTRRGVYYFNGTNLDKRSLLPAQALIYHELAPGHYWQAAMTFESKEITAYPRHNMAYSESWANFAGVELSYEQGIFRTPEERYGRLMFLSMFYARALADVGLNYFGRDFSWGMKVLHHYAFESDLQNRDSLVRDTTDWPAQILPYTFGMKAILRLREKARLELGKRFSAPRFYDAVFSVGEVPIPVLERQVDWFIAQERTGRAPGICEK